MHIKQQQPKDLTKFAKDIFAANKAKGFCNEERSDETLLVLIISEICEALEADRKDKYADEMEFVDDMELMGLSFKEAFEKRIKDTVEDELADTVIRCLDFIGYKGETVPAPSCGYTDFDDTFAETCYFLVRGLISDISEKEGVIETLLSIIGYCEINDIDIWWHIEQKLAYNKTREPKHGKKY